MSVTGTTPAGQCKRLANIIYVKAGVRSLAAPCGSAGRATGGKIT